MKKKIIAILLTMVFAATGAAAAQADEGIKVILDGQEINFDVVPQVIDGRTMVPMRAIFETLGYIVDWNADNQSIVATNVNTDKLICATVNVPKMVSASYAGYNKATDKDSYLTEHFNDIDSSPVIIDGRTLVPVRFVAEYANCTVNWDADSKTVSITDNNAKDTSEKYYEENKYIYSFENICGSKEYDKRSKTNSGITSVIYIYRLQSSADITSMCNQWCSAVLANGYNKLYSQSSTNTMFECQPTETLFAIIPDKTTMTVSITMVVSFPETSAGSTSSGYYNTGSSSSSSSSSDSGLSSSDRAKIEAEIKDIKEKMKEVKAYMKKLDDKIAEDKTALKNVQQNRDTQVIMGGSVVNVADPQLIKEINDAIDDLTKEKESCQKILDEYNDALDKYNDILKG